MKIEILGSDTVKITLTENELLQYIDDFDSLDENSPDSKRLIAHLINETRRRENIELGGDKLFIEAFAADSGKFYIYLSPCGGILRKEQKAQEELVLEFGSLSEVISLCRSIADKSAGGSLYSNGEKYRLVLTAAENKEALRMENEFSVRRLHGKSAVAATMEHFSPCISENAVRVLSML